MLEIIISLIPDTNYCQAILQLDGVQLQWNWEFPSNTDANYIKSFVLSDIDGMISYSSVTVVDNRI